MTSELPLRTVRENIHSFYDDCINGEISLAEIREHKDAIGKIREDYKARAGVDADKTTLRLDNLLIIAESE